METCLESLLTGLAVDAFDPAMARLATRHETGPRTPLVACFPVWFPGEIIEAAGCLPVPLLGGGATVEADRAHGRIQSFVCSIARTSLELVLSGAMRHVDAFVFSSICDVARNLAGVFSRNLPDRPVLFLHMPQNVTSPAAVGYLTQELYRLARFAADLTGLPPDPRRIADAIAEHRRWRSLDDALGRVRRDEPDRLRAHEHYVLRRAALGMARREASRLFEQALDLVRRRPVRPRDRVRVLLEGSFCEQPPPGLLETLEEAGLAIVDDDILVGSRMVELPVSGYGAGPMEEPLEALARAYLTRRELVSVCHDGARPREAGLLERVHAVRAQGVVFLSAKFCEPALYDYVLYKDALEREGIPHLGLEFEEGSTTTDSIRTQVETFVESILFFGEEAAV